MRLEVTDKEIEIESVEAPNNLLLRQQVRDHRTKSLFRALPQGVVLALYEGHPWGDL
jgi:hypothetical protein